MPRYKCKGIRGNWSDENMKLALLAVKQGTMKVYTAAKHYNVPRRTLRRYLEEKKEMKSILGRKPLLDTQQEKDLASRIIRLCNVGYPLTQRVLRTSVKTFCERNNISGSSRGLMVGRDWLRGFLKRHKNISRRKAQNLNPARAQKLNKAVVADYFAKLKKILEENDIMNKPERIFNIDEKGCQLNLHKAPQVLAARGTKRVHLVAAEHGENVTIVSCASALGHAIPPMILFKGKRMKPEWLDSLPTGAIAQMTPKGSMNMETFVNWIHHFAKFKLPGPCLLLFDGAKCHLDYSIVDAAGKYEIKLFCLPSNTTHELQPMDKTVFRSFEYYWDQEILTYWSVHEDRKITKHRFGVIFSKVWDKAATPANIKAGFEATGIFPFNPDRIPEEAYAPSIPTYNPATPKPCSGNQENEDPNDSDATDASYSLLAPPPPLNNEDDNTCSPTPLTSQGPAQRESLDNNILSPPNNSTNNNSQFIRHLVPNDGDCVLITQRPAENDCSLSLQRSLSRSLNCCSDNNTTPLFFHRPISNDTIDDILQCNECPGQDNGLNVDIPYVLQSHPSNIIENTFSRKNYALSPKNSSSYVFDSSDDVALVDLKQKKGSTDISRLDSNLVGFARLNDSYQSFCEMLKTPEKISSPKTAPRAKAINSLAQELTTSTFADKKDKPGPSKITSQKRKNIPKSAKGALQKKKITPQKRKQDPGKTDKRQSVSNKVPLKISHGKDDSRNTAESWYCFVCNEDRVADMRSCFLCATYVHEDCVGLTAEDTDKFVCIQCSED